MDKYKIDLPGAKDIVNRFGLKSGGLTQTFFSNELMRLSDDYAPFKQGSLKNSARLVDEGTAIEYRGPHPRVHWYGKVMAGSLPKQPTNIDMVYNGAPIRGPRWVERTYADNQDVLIQSVEKFIGRL